MISADLNTPAGFAERLARRAARRAKAHAVGRLLTRRADPRRWRLARLLWPDFRRET